MLRITGAVLLLSASAILGFGASGELKKHLQELESLIFSLEHMERELTNQFTPLPELLSKMVLETNGQLRKFFTLCLEALKNREGETFAQIWRQAIKTAGLRLEPEELTILADLGDVLGRYDAQSQSAALQKAQERLTQALEHSRTRQMQLGKVYTTLGVTVGALLVMILL